MKRYILLGVGGLFLCAMLIGDGMAVELWRQSKVPVVHPQKSSLATTAPTVAKQIFVDVPKFVVTIPQSQNDGGGTAYLQLAMSFMTTKKLAARDFKKLAPIIKSEIISGIMSSGMTLSDKPVTMKKKISFDSLQIANNVIKDADASLGAKPFFGCYITDYIIQ